LKIVLRDDRVVVDRWHSRSERDTPMTKELWTVAEVVAFFQVEEGLLRDLEEEEIICPACDQGLPSRLFDRNELEKIRIAKLLMEEMDVNLSGVEVILQMRQRMIEMRTQFDAILEDLADQLRQAFSRS